MPNNSINDLPSKLPSRKIKCSAGRRIPTSLLSKSPRQLTYETIISSAESRLKRMVKLGRIAQDSLMEGRQGNVAELRGQVSGLNAKISRELRKLDEIEEKDRNGGE